MVQGSWTTFFLSIALIMDIVGIILFFTGIFAPLSFWDFFVLSGPLLIFLSLVLWIFWYMAHLTVSEEELNLIKLRKVFTSH
uniref:Transmembrane protein 238 like n=1 Tax=Amphiprion percula TaxID=161767 RepID=A0A3P8TVV9_AMPPE